MSDALTPKLGLTLPAVGASQDSWGTKLNTNFSTLDNLLAGRNSVQNVVNGWRIGADNMVENWGRIATSSGGVGQFFFAKPCHAVCIQATANIGTQQNYTCTAYDSGDGASCTVYTFLNGAPASCTVMLFVLGHF